MTVSWMEGGRGGKRLLKQYERLKKDREYSLIGGLGNRNDKLQRGVVLVVQEGEDEDEDVDVDMDNDGGWKRLTLK